MQNMSVTGCQWGSFLKHYNRGTTQTGTLFFENCLPIPSLPKEGAMLAVFGTMKACAEECPQWDMMSGSPNRRVLHTDLGVRSRRTISKTGLSCIWFHLPPWDVFCLFSWNFRSHSPSRSGVEHQGIEDLLAAHAVGDQISSVT